MSNPKADMYNKVASRAEGASKRRSDHPTTSRSDIFSKLVKLVSLSEYRGSKPSVDRREANHGRPGDLVAIGHEPHSPVTVHLTRTLPTSISKETLRSSSDSNLAVSACDEEGRLAKGTDPTTIIALPQTHTIDGAWTKHERKSTRRKGKTAPLSEPATSLTPIPEIASAFERGYIPDFPFTTGDNFAEDALMDTDSTRARVAIALARAQLEHSRPASHYRKLERSSNRMMMLPDELEEYRASKAAKERQAKTPVENAAKTSDATHGKLNASDPGSVRKAVGQSQAMVLTLMAGKEAISHRTLGRKNHSSPPASSLTVDLPKTKRVDKPFQGLYHAGDLPPSPPPSIPLPRLPFKVAITAQESSSAIPKSEHPPNGTVHHAGAYKELPAEYQSDDEVLKHIDILMQSLLDSNLSRGASPQNSPQRPFSSLPSRRGRREREASAATADSSRYNSHQGGATERLRPSKSASVRQVKRRPQDAPSPAPTAPLPPVPSLTTYGNPSESGLQAHYELRFGTMPSSSKTPRQVSFSYYDVLVPPCTEDGMLTPTGHGTYFGDATRKSVLSNVSSGHTEKYFQQFTSPRSARQPATPTPAKLGRYSNINDHEISGKLQGCPPGIIPNTSPCDVPLGGVPTPAQSQGTPQRRAYTTRRY